MFVRNLGTWLILLSLAAPLRAADKIIDDSYDFDPTRPDGIQYGSDWTSSSTSSGSISRYNNTLHWTTTPEAKLIYFFQGNAIYYYADKDSVSAPVSIVIDDYPEEIASATSLLAQGQQLIWSKTGLKPGDHQVVIRHNGTSNQYLRLDYLRIESDHTFIPTISGPAASNVPSEALFVDDNHPSIVYSSNWTSDSTPQYGVYYGGTLHRSITSGDFVTLKFTGTAVWYFSNTNRRHGNVQVQIDGGRAETVSMFGSTGLMQQLMWSKSDLSAGEHTIIFAHADEDGVPMTLDFFRYLPSQPSSDRQANLGAIIGGVFGGVIFFVLCALVAVYFRRRRSPKSSSSNAADLFSQSEPDNYGLPNYGQASFRSSQPEWGYGGHPHPSQSQNHIFGVNHVSREKNRYGQARVVVRGLTDSGSSSPSTATDSDSVMSVAIGSAMVSERSQMLPPAYSQPTARQ